MRVVAMHVHHGLRANADAWLGHAEALCERWARKRGLPIAFDSRRLSTRPSGGDSVEAWARRERYAALRDMAQAAAIDLVLLAHHRRDQAETFILQALRGAGASGLAAMPRLAIDAGITWARPWLDSPRAAIEAYARRHRLPFVEDDSNADRRFARNRLRLDVWPPLLRAFPDAELTLATASRLAGDAKAVLDAATARDVDTTTAADGSLDLGSWRALPPARRRFVLVAWLRGRLRGTAPRTLVERLAHELDRPDATRWPAPGGELQRRRSRLAYVATERMNVDR